MFTYFLTVLIRFSYREVVCVCDFYRCRNSLLTYDPIRLFDNRKKKLTCNREKKMISDTCFIIY